jgi:LacI family transcriptional regulator
MSLSNETSDFDLYKSIISHDTLGTFDKIAKPVNCLKVTINDKKSGL